MSTGTDPRYEQAKSVNLIDYMAALTGSSPKNHGRYAMFCCPAHGERHESLSVYQNDAGDWKLKCHSTACDLSGDILDLVARLNNFNLSTFDGMDAALRYITNTEKPKPLNIQLTKRDMSDIPMSKVGDYYNNVNLAIPYCHKRRVADRLVHEHLIGAQVINAQIADGLPRVKITRYTIPNVFGDKVHTIKKRLDMDAALEGLSQFGQSCPVAYREICDRAAQESSLSGKSYTDTLIQNTFFPGRYSSEKGGQNRNFNMRALFTQVGDGKFAPRELDRVIGSVENKEFDQLALESAGFIAAGAKPYTGSNLPLIYAKVKEIWLWADNDEPGRIGLQKAIHAFEPIKHKVRGILIAPEPHKDANDLAQAGELIKFLDAYGIKPDFDI